jgi:hypothetical protein
LPVATCSEALVRGKAGGELGVDYLIVAPDPAGTIESLSALGYSLEAAVADLVDNSIDADATTVDVIFHWAGADSYVAVVDDGRGMTADDLRDAMALALRGPRIDRGGRELGRFGMGLKTASFSQASTLVVWSRTDASPPAVRVWDLERVVSTREWQLATEPDAASGKVLAELYSLHPRAKTIVLWRSLTKIVEAIAQTDDTEAHRHFLDAVARVERHLGMTFGRFISGRWAGRRRLNIRVNGARVQAWDPFMETNPYTSARPIEHLAVDGHGVVVRPFVLPPKRHLTEKQYAEGAGPLGWQAQQGFYVYRNDRLIVAGDWLALANLRKDEKHNLARISIEIPSDLDHLWSIDVKKATARPPLPLRAALTRIAKATRLEAQRVQAAIGRTTALTRSDELTYLWQPERREGQVRLRLNWNHPLVKEALRVERDLRPTVRALLTLLEETVPVPALRLMFDTDEDRDHVPFSDSPPEEVRRVAERLYAAYISQQLSPAQARTRLRYTAPFDEYPDLLDSIDLGFRKCGRTEDGVRDA